MRTNKMRKSDSGALAQNAVAAIAQARRVWIDLREKRAVVVQGEARRWIDLSRRSDN